MTKPRHDWVDMVLGLSSEPRFAGNGGGFPAIFLLLYEKEISASSAPWFCCLRLHKIRRELLVRGRLLPKQGLARSALVGAARIRSLPVQGRERHARRPYQ